MYELKDTTGKLIGLFPKAIDGQCYVRDTLLKETFGQFMQIGWDSPNPIRFTVQCLDKNGIVQYIVTKAPATVVFSHDDAEKKWEARAFDVENAGEARQAFSAVVLTCQELDVRLLQHTRIETVASGGYLIIPAVKRS